MKPTRADLDAAQRRGKLDFHPCPKCDLEIGGKEGELCWNCDGLERMRAFLKNRQWALQQIGAPRKVVKTRFEDLDEWPRDHRRTFSLKEWRGEPAFVTIEGLVGTGKTFLACAMAYRAIVRRFWDRPLEVTQGSPPKLPGYFVQANQVAGIMINEPHLRRRILGTWCLVVDDLGTGHPGGAWNHLETLAVNRDANALRTIWTTNFTLEQLETAETAGERTDAPRITDRLAGGYVCELSGRSRRHG